MQIKATLYNFVDYFIHDSIKGDKPLYEKTKITVLVFLSIVSFSIINLIFYLWHGYYANIKAYHNYLALATTVASILIIKKTGKTNLALAGMSVVGIYLILVSASLSGGIHSNDILWFSVLSTASFMFISIKTGIINTLLCFLGIVSFYLLDTFEIVQFPLDDVSNSMDYKFINYLLILYVLTMMVYVLVKGNNKLQDVVQLIREQKVREEIARDFHDQIGNKLTSIRHLSELVKKGDSSTEREQLLSKIDSNAKDVYDNFRDFIWALDAKSDSIQELFMYLRDFADDCFKFSDTRIYITAEPEELPDVFLPGASTREIVPLFKEAITNTQKHADAKHVWFVFRMEQNHFYIRLKDDGIGFNTSETYKGNGLGNIQKRATKSGGNIQLTSKPTEGTEIIYTIKLP